MLAFPAGRDGVSAPRRPPCLSKSLIVTRRVIRVQFFLSLPREAPLRVQPLAIEGCLDFQSETGVLGCLAGAPQPATGRLPVHVGVKHVRTVDPYNVAETMEIIREEVNRNEASVIITKNSPCMLLRRARPRERFAHPSYRIDEDNCTGCGLCLDINCPAISWAPKDGKTKSGRKRKGTSHINQDQCVGCAICTQVCEFESIAPKAE